MVIPPFCGLHYTLVCVQLSVMKADNCYCSDEIVNQNGYQIWSNPITQIGGWAISSLDLKCYWRTGPEKHNPALWFHGSCSKSVLFCPLVSKNCTVWIGSTGPSSYGIFSSYKKVNKVTEKTNKLNSTLNSSSHLKMFLTLIPKFHQSDTNNYSFLFKTFKTAIHHYKKISIKILEIRTRTHLQLDRIWNNIFSTVQTEFRPHDRARES